MRIIDLSSNAYSNRHGSYGGAAGDKDGILIDDKNWIVKYPKPEREFRTPIGMSYNTAPISEYIGSHIYQILGIPAHETVLGYRNNKIVVACKDFCEYGTRLMEMRSIKNAANRELEPILDNLVHYSTTGDRVNLNELLLHLEYNPVLQKIPDIKEHFWDMVVVDVFIDNKDRNNGNWGLLYDEMANLYRMAPVYDNGNSFANKSEDNKLEKILESGDKVKIDAYTGSRTIYNYGGHMLSAKKLVKMNIPDLQEAICRIVPKIQEKMEDILKLIDDIPEQYKGKIVCSGVRKQYYKESLVDRAECILYPAFEEIMKSAQKLEDIEDLEVDDEDFEL